MSWTELFIMVAIVDSVVIWFALASSKERMILSILR